jgi:hypothetical protein
MVVTLISPAFSKDEEGNLTVIDSESKHSLDDGISLVQLFEHGPSNFQKDAVKEIKRKGLHLYKFADGKFAIGNNSNEQVFSSMDFDEAIEFLESE